MSVGLAFRHIDDLRKDNEPAKRWFVVKSLARKEFLAEQHLRRQNFETYLPLMTVSANSPRRTGATRQSAFFPSYLFVRLNPEVDRWRSVNGTIGVATILQSGGRPAPTPVGLVEHMIAKTGKDGGLGFEDSLRWGEAIQVVGGPFDRLMGVFQELDGQGRARVLLELLGRPVTVVLSRASVMAV